MSLPRSSEPAMRSWRSMRRLPACRTKHPARRLTVIPRSHSSPVTSRLPNGCIYRVPGAHSSRTFQRRPVMAFRINHIHLKAPDPRKTAEWYARAFNFKIMSDETRVFGDRFIRCQSEDGGMGVNISGARSNERLGPGDASAHHGLEHFGFDSTHLETDIKRLEGLGARLLEGPIQIPNGPRIAFMWAPDDVRVELIEPRKSGASGGC